MQATSRTPSSSVELPVERAERIFSTLVRRYGRSAPGARRFELQPPVAADGQDDCWTHAWNLAAASPGSRYVEGVCVRGRGLAQHAWVEEDTLFGPRIVECTAGYEEARNYRGLVVDHSPRGLPATLTAEWDGPRVSVIQALIGGGHTVDQVLAIIAPQ